MKALFFDLADFATGLVRGHEVLLANFAGEATDFIRFNRARVRQPMSVRQAYLTLTLIDGARRDSVTLALTGDRAQDEAAVRETIGTLRADLPSLPADPYLLYATEPSTSNRESTGRLPSAAEAMDAIDAAARGTDFVGIFSNGPIYRGFANSLGSRHWHAVDAFLLDWSLYHSGDKAVKSSWSGSQWDAAELSRRIDAARTQLDFLARPARTLAPGEVRAYLTPAALDELLWMLNWGGVSCKAQRTKQSCIQKLAEGSASFSPLLSLREDIGAGLAPAFDAMGFAKPTQVSLVEAGRHSGSMVSPRTAKEYGLQANGADDDEGMQSMAMAGGTLAEGDVLAALDTGLWIGNLHYLNFSDRANGRITGMTRFATFWVEGGKIVAPVNVMRFDDTLYRMLGDNLEALTRQPEWILNNGTYGGRSVQTSRVSGALLKALALTL